MRPISWLHDLSYSQQQPVNLLMQEPDLKFLWCHHVSIYRTRGPELTKTEKAFL